MKNQNKLIKASIIVVNSDDVLEIVEFEKIKKDTCKELTKLYGDFKVKYLHDEDVEIYFSINDSELKTMEELIEKGIFIV